MVLYEYDDTITYGGKIGNMTSKTEGGTTIDMGYSSEHIHAPSSHTGSSLNTYDKNGNSSAIGDDIHYYDAENRLSQINAWTNYIYFTTFLYDGSGEMARRKVHNYNYNSYQKDVYVDGIYQEQSYDCSAPVAYTKYYMALGRIIAARTGEVDDGTLDDGDHEFYLADHLGSTSTTITSSGDVQAVRQYWPFGAPRSASGTPLPEQAYTGQREESHSHLGLYYYHARFYSTELARFLSPDPIGEDAKYSYALNNPILFSDPSGHSAMIACGTSNDCDHGQNIDHYRDLVIADWIATGRFAGQSRAFLNDAWKWFVGMMQIPGYNGAGSVYQFGVAFFDSSSAGWGGVLDVVEDWWNPIGGDFNKKVAGFLAAERAFFGPRGADLWVGFSWGGAVVLAALNAAPNEQLPLGAILLEAAVNGAGDLRSDVLHTTRVVAWHDTNFPFPTRIGGVHGDVRGVWNFTSSDCGAPSSHCTHQQHQALMVDVARNIAPYRDPSTARRMFDVAGAAGVGVSCIPDGGKTLCN